MRKHTWSNVRGQLVTDVSVVVPFLSSGYYDPGVCSGPPERCYPPEGDDERVPDGCAYLDFGKGERIMLTTEQTIELFWYLVDEVQEVEMESDKEAVR